jgi:hypothetical protein
MPLPLLSYDQLLTANFFDFRQIVLCKLPEHIWRDVIVSMTKNIADPCYFSHGISVRRSFMSSVR